MTVSKAVFWRGWLGLLALSCLLGGPTSMLADEDTLPPRVYIRDVKGLPRAGTILSSEARLRGVREVLVAFDQITFAPPPGRNEYSSTHGYARDIDGWCDVLENWAGAGGAPTIRAVGTLGPQPLVVGTPGWRDRLRQGLERRWWNDPGFREFEPALRWIRRWMPREDGMLVLIASEFTPEQWIDPRAYALKDESWRHKLRRGAPGGYWDEEAIGSTLAKSNCPLLVVAPEVTFGDQMPLATLPDLPWASRPQRPPVISLEEAVPADDAETPSREDIRRELDERLRELIPDDDLRRETVERMLKEIPAPEEDESTPSDPAPHSGTPIPRPEEVASSVGGRFHSYTPWWFPQFRGSVPINNHAPSAFGYWPYARACVKSGGRYVFYPFPPSTWLDVCPRDEHQVRRLAPELGSLRAFAQARSGDRALDALCRAAAVVVDDTPWSDAWRTRLAKGWSGFNSVNPLVRTKNFRARRKPFDTHVTGDMRELRRLGEHLGKVAQQYERAIAILDRALARIRGAEDTSSHARSIADLRLGRFWFAMSAFHLEALGLYLREIERYAPPGWSEQTGKLSVTLLPTIKMSDCLDAYDGRVLPPEGESAYQRILHHAAGPYAVAAWGEGTVIPGQQGNLLLIPRSSPDYRAKRGLSNVLRHLDRRLMARALDMIHAAREVVEHHARTPWGWTTYYAEAHTYVFFPLPAAEWSHPRTGEGEDTPEPPVTPTSPGGGSSPGGPSTGR